MLFFILTLGSALCFACGNILEKSGISVAVKNVTLKTPILFFKKILTSFYWWIGIAFSGLATIGYYIAMAKYDISLVQPMMVLNPVLTALFGFRFLKEKITKKIFAAICCVLLGLLLAAKNLGENSSIQNVSALWIFSSIVIVAVLLFRFLHKDRESTDSLIIGAGFGLSAVFYKSLSIDFMLDEPSVALILDLLLDPRALGYAVLYAVAFAFSQIAFSRGRALFIIPFSAAVGAAIPILAGAFVFGEHFPVNKIISVILVWIGSVLFVVRRPHRKKKLEK